VIDEAHLMNRPHFLSSIVLFFVLCAFGVSSSSASTKQSHKITRTQAERIALTKVPGGKVDSAELATSHGKHFWSVYVSKAGSKNAKEIRVDSKTGQVIKVQTEKPADRAEGPQ
jgi:Peptidase propeptide and YPEB domain